MSHRSYYYNIYYIRLEEEYTQGVRLEPMANLKMITRYLESMESLRKGQRTKLKLLGILKELNIHSKSLEPTSKYLASRMRLTTKQVQRHLKALIQEKQIAVKTTPLKFDAKKNKLYKKRYITILSQSRKLPEPEINLISKVRVKTFKEKAFELYYEEKKNRAAAQILIDQENEEAYRKLLEQDRIKEEKQKALVEAITEPTKPYVTPQKYVMPKPIWVEHKFE